ncbi:MAG: hypothetical protein IPP58_15230 [Holophagaceae bacterium]|uniref:Uncharacterized protein n=1 Tax=Candidatus Geothrix skivensis TaxID=2954439 RepID=A0A9D7SJX2_9BACT|nr:hypothetical protein [Candidatus Geothrix skivensis]
MNRRGQGKQQGVHQGLQAWRALSRAWSHVGRLLAAVALAVGAGQPAILQAADPALPGATLTAEQAARDVRVLQRALKTLHPALTKYRTPKEMETAFAWFEARGQAARTVTEMYLAATELAAAIR